MEPTCALFEGQFQFPVLGHGGIHRPLVLVLVLGSVL